MKFLVFCFGLFVILLGCGGGEVPTDYSEWEEETDTSSTAPTPTKTSHPGDVTQSPESAPPSGETAGREFVPGVGGDDVTRELWGDMREVRTKYKDWMARATAILRRYQDGVDVSMSKVKSIHDEGISLAQKAQGIADKLRSIDPAKHAHNINSYTSVAGEINHLCSNLRDILAAGK